MSVEHSTSPELWRAAWQLADAWSATPLVRDFAGTLPRSQRLDNRGDKATGVPALLQHLDMTAGMMMKPLMLGSRLPVMLDEPLFTRGAPAIDEGEIALWVTMAGRVEAAHRATLAWLRSRLAGYPILRAPQLAPGTPLTTFEMTVHYIWTKEELSAGLNKMPAPLGVSELLGAGANLSADLEQAACDLVTNLEAAPAWIRLHNALEALDDDGKVALRVARRELTGRLSENAVNDHEEHLAWPRHQYRGHVTNEVIDSLTGSAHEYADAFSHVHELLTLVACDIFAELALYGEPWSLPVVNLEIPEPEQPTVAFEGEGAAGFFVTTGQVLWLANNYMTDAVRIETKSMKSDVEGLRDHFEARVLIGTGQGWPASTVEPLGAAGD